jgi:CDP-glycerol glycerophosphotransferase
VRVETQDKKLHHLAWRGTDSQLDRKSGPGDGLRVRASGFGYLELHDRRWQVVAEKFTVADDGQSVVVLAKASFADSDSTRLVMPNLVLANGRSVIRPSRTEWVHARNEFLVEFPLAQEKWAAFPQAPESGSYTLRCLTAGDGSTNGAYWVPVAPLMEASLPLEFALPTTTIRVTRTAKAAALSVQFNPPFEAVERGRLMQSRLQREIPALIRQPVEAGAVLFESFSGKTIGDSGLGLFNEMVRRGDTRAKYWTVRDFSMAVPTGALPVIMYSREWYRLLHTAEFVVNNSNFPYFYRKNPGQKYIQTWHGTPLKKIGNDIVSSQLSLPYIGLMKRESGYWDYLLAQNPFAEEVLPKAFGFEGSTLAHGYPRNDALIGPAAAKKRKAVRAALGLADGMKAVLYAPTWRDNVRSANNQYDLVNFLDVEKAGDMLGADYAFLLRGHHNVSGQRSTTGLDKTIDVTAYPDVNDLYLAAAAPGPLARTTHQLAEAIAAGSSENHYAARYESFRTRFAGLDDGRSSARVYDEIWGDVKLG